MKSYTSLEQSKKLAEILPAESADMSWGIDDDTLTYSQYPELIPYIQYTMKEFYIPCWSLAALLNILSNRAYSIDEDASVSLDSYKDVKWDLSIINSGLESVTKSDPIDACVEMILKLHEQELL